MRPHVPVLILALSSLACGGAPTPAPSSTPPAQAPPGAVTPAAPLPGLVSAPGEAAFADRYLVVLGSKRDAGEAIPGLAALASHPEVVATPARLASSRFKNLMPCYTVTIAGGLEDKAAALALSATLKGIGVDNYVKNAGAYVPRSAAIDAYCEASPVAPSGAARIVTLVDGRPWLPLGAPGAVVENATRGAGHPQPLGSGFDAWYTAVATTQVGDVSVGGSYRLTDVASGASSVCAVSEIAALTLGTPHFGVLQLGKLTAPSCGEPDLYAGLTCEGMPQSGGPWLAVPAGATAPVAYRSAPVSPALEAAGNAAIAGDAGWAAGPESGEEAVTRTVTVTRWTGGAGDFALVEGTVSWGNGVCGGDEKAWRAIFPVSGDGLGAALGPWTIDSFSELTGVVDVDGDGRPEWTLAKFPSTTAIQGADGQPRGAFEIAYCDCPC